MNIIVVNLVSVLAIIVICHPGNFVNGASLDTKFAPAPVPATSGNGKFPNQYGLLFGTDADGNAERSGRSMSRSSDNNKNSTGSVASTTSSGVLGGWNLQRIVKMVSLAVETYQQLDMSEIDCQKKLLCELQDGKDFAATTTRALSNVMLYFDFFKRIPHMEEYREAIKTGQRRMTSRSSADKCDYTKCKFSISEFNEKYRRLLHS